MEAVRLSAICLMCVCLSPFGKAERPVTDQDRNYIDCLIATTFSDNVESVTRILRDLGPSPTQDELLAAEKHGGDLSRDRMQTAKQTIIERYSYASPHYAYFDQEMTKAYDAVVYVWTERQNNSEKELDYKHPQVRQYNRTLARAVSCKIADLKG